MQLVFFFLLSALAFVNFDVCSIDFVMLLFNGVPSSIFVLKQQCAFTQMLLRLSSSPAAVLKRCSQNHENLALIFQTAFSYCAKNELKSLSCRKSEPPAKMQRTTRKLNNKPSFKHSDV